MTDNGYAYVRSTIDAVIDRIGFADDDAPTPDDVLAVDIRIHAKVTLGVGGPTTYVDYVFADDGAFMSATWETSDTPYASGPDWVSYELDDRDAETLADAYCGGLDALAEYVTRGADR